MSPPLIFRGAGFLLRFMEGIISTHVIKNRLGACPARSPDLRHQFLNVMLLSAIIAGLIACAPRDESGDAVPTRDINEVMEAHITELMAIPNVIGAAIGELDDKTPCILVLVVERTDEIERKVPRKLEGHPTRIVVTGVIKPLEDETSPR